MLKLLAAFVLLAGPAAADNAVDRDAYMLDNVLGACVHSDGNYNDAQVQTLRPLKLKNIRMDAFYLDPGSTIKEFSSWNTLGIMAVEHDKAIYELFNHDPEAFIDRYVKSAPWVKEWEFGNEPDNFNKISAAEYVAALTKAAAIFARKYPRITVVSAAPVGNKSGAKYFDAMVKAGLLRIPNIVIGVHIYTIDPDKFKAARGRRIWVTETGTAWNDQEHYYRDKIVDIQRTLRPERIYWYAHWEGKPVGKGFGWISLAPGTKSASASPLYQRLLRSRMGKTAAATAQHNAIEEPREGVQRVGDGEAAPAVEGGGDSADDGPPAQ